MEYEKNSAVSTPEMVTISRAEYDSQQAKLAELAELKLQNQWLLEQLGLAKKRQFGTSSEHLQEGLMDQLSLMANEAEAYAYGTKNATAEQVAVKAHARKRQSGSVLDIVPEGTPTEVVEHRLCEEERTCDTCGAVMEEIGKEVRRSLKMEPAQFWIRGKDRRMSDLLQIPLSLVFSRVLNLYSALIPYEAAEHGFGMNLLLLLAAILFTGAGAAITVNMRLVPNPGDGIVAAVADKIGRDQGFAKNLFDVGCVAVTCVLGLLASGGIVGIGIGTVAAMIGVGRSIFMVNWLGKERMCRAAGLLRTEAVPCGE